MFGYMRTCCVSYGLARINIQYQVTHAHVDNPPATSLMRCIVPNSNCHKPCAWIYATPDKEPTCLHTVRRIDRNQSCVASETGQPTQCVRSTKRRHQFSSFAKTPAAALAAAAAAAAAAQPASSTTAPPIAKQRKHQHDSSKAATVVATAPATATAKQQSSNQAVEGSQQH